MIASGLDGYFRNGSVPSLRWRCGMGSLFLLSQYLVKKDNPKKGHALGVLVGGLTSFAFSVRLRKMIKNGMSVMHPVSLWAGLGLVCATLNAKMYREVEGGYSPGSVQAAWDNHFSAFGEQDLDKIMLDYTEDSLLRLYDFTTSNKT